MIWSGMNTSPLIHDKNGRSWGKKKKKEKEKKKVVEGFLPVLGGLGYFQNGYKKFVIW